MQVKRYKLFPYTGMHIKSVSVIACHSGNIQTECSIHFTKNMHKIHHIQNGAKMKGGGRKNIYMLSFFKKYFEIYRNEIITSFTPSPSPAQ